MRAFVENAREMVADETPRSLASSLELIRFFSEFTTLAPWAASQRVRRYFDNAAQQLAVFLLLRGAA